MASRNDIVNFLDQVLEVREVKDPVNELVYVYDIDDDGQVYRRVTGAKTSVL